VSKPSLARLAVPGRFLQRVTRADRSDEISVVYELLPAKAGDLAKSDASRRIFRLIPIRCADFLANVPSCKEITRGLWPRHLIGPGYVSRDRHRTTSKSPILSFPMPIPASGGAAESGAAESLLRSGQLLPIVVVAEDAGWVLIDGYQRVEAARRAGIDTLKAQILPQPAPDAGLPAFGQRRGAQFDVLEQAGCCGS